MFTSPAPVAPPGGAAPTESLTLSTLPLNYRRDCVALCRVVHDMARPRLSAPDAASTLR